MLAMPKYESCVEALATMFQRNCNPEKETESLENMICEQGLEEA